MANTKKVIHHSRSRFSWLLLFLSLVLAGSSIGAAWYGVQSLRQESAQQQMKGLIKQGAHYISKKQTAQAGRLFGYLNQHYAAELERPGYFFQISKSYYDLSYSLLTKNRYRDAEKWARKGLAIDPGSIILLKLLGTIYEKEAKFEAAAATFTELCRIMPSDRKLRKQLSRLQRRIKAAPTRKR